jgi:hypothetical protein
MKTTHGSKFYQTISLFLLITLFQGFNFYLFSQGANEKASINILYYVSDSNELKFAFDGLLAYQKIINDKIRVRAQSPDSNKMDLSAVLKLAGYKVETAVVKGKSNLKRMIKASKSDVIIVDSSAWWEKRKFSPAEPLELNFKTTYSLTTAKGKKQNFEYKSQHKASESGINNDSEKSKEEITATATEFLNKDMQIFQEIVEWLAKNNL